MEANFDSLDYNEKSIFYMELNELEKIKMLWDQYALKDSSNFIRLENIMDFLNSSLTGVKIPECDKKLIEEQLDKNGNGYVDFIDFAEQYEDGLFNEYMIEALKYENIMEIISSSKGLKLRELLKITDAWKLFETENKKILSENLFDLLFKLHIKVPSADKINVINRLDRNGSGFIDYIDFLKSYDDGVFNKYQVNYKKKLRNFILSHLAKII